MHNSYAYAVFSNVVYKSNDIDIETFLISALPGWKKITISGVSNTGTKCIAFSNETTKSIIVSIRGSLVLENWITNFKYLRTVEKPPCYEEVKDFINKLKEIYNEYVFSYTGHSLGAYLAELYTCEHSAGKAITFESPGCKEIAEKLGFLKDEGKEPDITTYLSSPNLINTYCGHVGEVRRVYIHHTDTHGIGENPEHDDLPDPDDLPNPFELLKSCFAFLSSLSIKSLNYLKRIHSMDKILNSFDKDAGEPYLYRHVWIWPSHNEYLNWLEPNPIPVSAQGFLYGRHSINRSIEQKNSSIPNYVIGHFLLPGELDNLSGDSKIAYAINSSTRYHEFFGDMSKEGYKLFKSLTGDNNQLLNQLIFSNRRHNMPNKTKIEETMFEINKDPGITLRQTTGIIGAGITGGITGHLASGAVQWIGGASATFSTLNPAGAAVGAAYGSYCMINRCITEEQKRSNILVNTCNKNEKNIRELNKNNTTLHEKNKNLQIDVNQNNNEISRLKDKNTKLDKKNKELQKNINQNNKEISRLKDKNAKLDKKNKINEERFALLFKELKMQMPDPDSDSDSDSKANSYDANRTGFGM